MQVIATKLGRSTPFHNPVTMFQSRDCKPSVTKLAKIPHTLVPAPQLHMYAGYVVKNVRMIVTWHHDVTDKQAANLAGRWWQLTVCRKIRWKHGIVNHKRVSYDSSVSRVSKLIFRWRSPLASNRTTIVHLNPVACMVQIKWELVILPFVCFSK